MLQHRSPNPRGIFRLISATSDVRAPNFLAFALLFVMGASCEENIAPGPEGEPEAFEPEGEPEAQQVVTRVVAAAGADRDVLEGARVVLDGSASRALDGTLNLTWSQTSGAPVLLTNPSGPHPAFVAPLGPDTLTFQLRAESGYDADLDTVTIQVSNVPRHAPFYVQVPPDTTALEDATVAFQAETVGAAAGDITFSARALCDATVDAAVDGTITVNVTDALPCAVAVDATHANGLQSSRGVFVIWPDGTTLPPQTTFVETPTLLEPGAPGVLRFDSNRIGTAGATARTWSAGELLDLGSVVDTTDVLFDAPLRRGRIALGAEVRLGAISGGVRYVLAEVSAGAGNRAPTADAGVGREVAPGGSFAIDISGTNDVDGDPLDIRIVQVIGQAAVADAAVPYTFQAPTSETVMLFHVIANDGIVDSAPSSVRVTVSESAQNTAPTLALDPIRYVQPGAAFLLDASGAVDNSGVIASYSISQDPDDAVLLLEEPVDGATITLTAQSEGDVYHFRLSAVDVEGLRGIADVEVRVERAGPYVDPARGTPDGDGTLQAPFSTLAAAVDVASRHRLPELLLVTGEHAPWSGEFPPGLDLRGGYIFDGAAYVESSDDDVTLLPLGESGIVFLDAEVENAHLRLDAPETTMTARGTTTFENVRLLETSLHSGPLLTVPSGAFVTLRSSVVAPSAPPLVDGESTTIRVDGSTASTTSLNLEDTEVLAGNGGTRTAIHCRDGAVNLVGGRVGGGRNASAATALSATDCAIEILGTTVVGGDGNFESTGLDLLRTILFADENSLIIATGDDGDAVANAVATEEAVGLRFRGAAVGVIRGRIQTQDAIEVPGTNATALVCESPTLSLDGATLTSAASGVAIAANIRASNFRAARTNFNASTGAEAGEESRSVALRVSGENLQLDECALVASGVHARGLEGSVGAGNHGARVLLSDVEANGQRSSVAVALANANAVVVSSSRLSVTGDEDATPVLALSALQATVRNSTVTSRGVLDATGIALGASAPPSIIERTFVDVFSEANATACIANGALDTRSSAYLATSGAEGEPAAALDARASLTLVHGTLSSNRVGLLLDNDGASVTLANSAFIAPTAIAISQSVAFPSDSVALAFDAETLLDRPEAPVTSVGDFSALGCVGCLAFDEAAALDANARLLPGENPLVDSASTSVVDVLDIDGEARPQGLGPDIGCDERPDDAG